jgi:pimeloyl-ACP methyl ester carboxylesterase
MQRDGGASRSRTNHFFGALVIALCSLSIATAGEPKVVMEEFMIPAADPGVDLYVRNKHLQGAKKFAPGKILLYVHGATYPSETTFDLRLDGLSWMDYIARHGYDVYMVDVRGFGKSTHPPEMRQPAAQNEPIVHTETAVKDVGAAVDFILKRREVTKINLLGWSWGTSIMGWYTTQNNDKVNRLVLYAPLWFASGSLVNPDEKIGAYRTVTREAARTRWLSGVPEDKKAELIPAGWFDTFADATIPSDGLRAPNGAVQDGRDFWGKGQAQYDPAAIRVPTFVAHAEWDADLPSSTMRAFFEQLRNAPYKRYVEIGEGTHTIMMEKNRMQLFGEVQHFLDEPAASF